MSDVLEKILFFVILTILVIVASAVGVVLIGIALALVVSPFVVAYKFLVWIF